MSAPRCKPGDLAVVVRAKTTPEMIGRFVVVDRRFVNGEPVSGFLVDEDERHAWVIRASVSGQLLPWRSGDGSLDMVKERIFADSCMRPIRPNDGEDESLSWSQPRVTESA